MDNSIQYEDFVSTVRKSLYGTENLEEVQFVNKNKRTKKIKFNTDNTNSVNQQKRKSQKLENRKPTPYKSKLKKQNFYDSFHVEPQESCSPGAYIKPTNKPTKRKIVVSFSSSDEPFDEEEPSFNLSPSKSEMDTFNSSFKNSNGTKTTTGSSTKSYNGTNFDLNAFFNRHEISGSAESITQAHSGIDYEFVSDYASEVDIRSQAITDVTDITDNEEIESDIADNEEIENDIADNEEIESDIADNIEEEDRKIESNIDNIVDEVETIVISDDANEGNGNVNKQIEAEVAVNAADYYDFGDQKLVILKENQTVAFHGLFELKVLHGKIEVFGSILQENSNVARLYSPKGSSFLSIKNVTKTVTDKSKIELIEIAPFIPTPHNIEFNNITIEANCAIFLCTKLNDPRIQFVEKHTAQKLFPKTKNGSKNVQVIFDPPENVNVLKVNPIWDEMVKNVKSRTKLMLVGGKGVGKSTLLRYTINKLLNKFDKVRVLDLDPGQSEFTVPGCISIVTVTEPVFGPSFTHLKQTDRSLLSNINVSNQLLTYVKCVKFLSYHLETLENCPTVINYMGFTQGIGLELIAAVIKYVRPSNIIQINSANKNKNFIVDLTPEIVEEYGNKFSVDDNADVIVGRKYKFFKMAAMNDGNDGWVLEPRKSREMSILAYFGQMMGNGVNSLTSSELPMYRIQLSEIKITDQQGKEVDLAVANGRMVALCSLEEETNIFVCLGHGLIRGIDVACSNLVLLTPESADVLEKVYYLVVTGNVSLPPSVYMTPDNVTGSVCYVNDGDLESLAQITKRSYLPANKN